MIPVCLSGNIISNNVHYLKMVLHACNKLRFNKPKFILKKIHTPRGPTLFVFQLWRQDTQVSAWSNLCCGVNTDWPCYYCRAARLSDVILDNRHHLRQHKTVWNEGNMKVFSVNEKFLIFFSGFLFTTAKVVSTSAMIFFPSNSYFRSSNTSYSYIHSFKNIPRADALYSVIWNLFPDHDLFFYQVAAVHNSSEFRLGLRKNAKMNPGNM